MSEYKNALADLMTGIKEANEQGVGVVWGDKFIQAAAAELSRLQKVVDAAVAYREALRGIAHLGETCDCASCKLIRAIDSYLEGK